MNILSAILIPLLFVLCEGAFHDRKIFVSKFAGKAIRSHANLKTIRTQIRNDALASLKALPQAIKADLLKEAKRHLQSDHWPQLTASGYMSYYHTGSRSPFSDEVDQLLSRLAFLVVGHELDRLKTGKSSSHFLDEIINGVWMLLEQSTWCMPWHLVHQGTSDHLPLPDRHAIDLNAGETAKLLAWTRLLLYEDFDHVSKVINRRIDFELRRRIFEAFTHRDFSWEGFQNHFVNNWNIWCNGNILKAALYTLDDQPLFEAVLNKTLYSADYFLDGYGNDGGCEEGPAYWREAGGRLLDYFDSIEYIYPGAKEYFRSNKLLKAIGDYSYKMRITDNWFVNFADSVPKLSYPPELLFNYGELFNDDVMRHYAAYMLQYVQSNGKQSSENFRRYLGWGDLNAFFSFAEVFGKLEQLKPIAPELETIWLPDVQVMSARSKKEVEEEKSRFFLAAKAGNNHESHNHNDLGNFILYQGGHPVLIDIGVGTYTAKTFSSHRYEIFYMQSQYHNCPTINGVQQHNGNGFSSKSVHFSENEGEGVSFSADIAGGYPKTAHIKHWIRSLAFNRTTNEIILEDSFQLDHFLQAQQLHFILPKQIKVTQVSDGLHLSDDGKVNVKMELYWNQWESSRVKIEMRSLEGDHKLTSVWGDSIQRITLVSKLKETKGRFIIKLKSGY